ncbi:hypothetical protein AOLI_G00012120 [Acnodon oligacanthus]
MGSSALWVFLPLEVIIAVTCCLGNVLVIWAVWTCGALRQPTFCFIVSLAVADFLVGSVAIPVAVLVDIRMNTSFYGCLFMCCIIIMLQVASVVLLLAIAVDRFLCVHIPLTYKSTVSKKRLWMVVVLCWVTAALLSFIPISALWVFLTLEVIIAVACCLGNVLVIRAVWTCGALRQPTFCFIVSLAVADFLVGLVVIPIAVLVDIGMNTSFYGCLFMCCIMMMLEVASVALLLAIAVDRFLRVRIPLTLYLPPLAIMTGLYCYIFLTTRRQLRANIGVGAVSRTYYQKEHRLAASLVLVLVLFVVCWLPVFLMFTSDRGSLRSEVESLSEAANAKVVKGDEAKLQATCGDSTDRLVSRITAEVLKGPEAFFDKKTDPVLQWLEVCAADIETRMTEEEARISVSDDMAANHAAKLANVEHKLATAIDKIGRLEEQK